MKKPTAESMAEFKLIRNRSGALSFTSNAGLTHNGVYPVRAFPISAPEDGLSLFDANGHEIAWIENLSNLPSEIQLLITEELARREFMPTIHRILQVNSFATPSTWQLETNLGSTELTLKTEDSIRRLTAISILITDSHGIHFLVPNIDQLDQHSRKLLDRFL